MCVIPQLPHVPLLTTTVRQGGPTSLWKCMFKNIEECKRIYGLKGDIRCVLDRGLLRGTKPPFDFLPLLAQHSFAHAIAIFWQSSGFHQTSHSSGALHGNFKPIFRCTRIQQSGRGLCRRCPSERLLTQHPLAGAADNFQFCSKLPQTGPSARSILANFKPPFRCARIQQSGRGLFCQSLHRRQ